MIRRVSRFGSACRAFAAMGDTDNVPLWVTSGTSSPGVLIVYLSCVYLTISCSLLKKQSTFPFRISIQNPAAKLLIFAGGFFQRNEQGSRLAHKRRAALPGLTDFFRVAITRIAVECQPKQSAAYQYSRHHVAQVVQDAAKPFVLAVGHKRLRSAVQCSLCTLRTVLRNVRESRIDQGLPLRDRTLRTSHGR